MRRRSGGLRRESRSSPPPLRTSSVFSRAGRPTGRLRSLSSIAEAAARRGDYAVDLLARLVAEPSVEGSPAIQRCLDLIEAEVAAIAEVVRPEYDGVSNLIARFGDTPARVAFSGHVDVVAADGDWSTPPFELVRDAEVLRGRGSCDMKGGVAAFVAAIWALADIGELERCGLELVLTGDEEVG